MTRTAAPSDPAAAFARLDATAQAELVAKGEVTAVELVDACEKRVAAVDRVVHAFVATDFERA
ncbi:MAG: amidase, partial [Myxococcales bacterium]|nr:amidase [Myxococcales bacterium]